MVWRLLSHPPQQYLLLKIRKNVSKNPCKSMKKTVLKKAKMLDLQSHRKKMPQTMKI